MRTELGNSCARLGAGGTVRRPPRGTGRSDDAVARKVGYHMNTCSYMPLMPQGDVDGLTEIFRVLGDPTRVRILDVLSRDELSVGDIAARLGVTESAVSHQLRLLRNTRIVRSRREGRMIFYALDDQHVLALFRQGLRHVQEGGRQAAR